MTRFLRTDDGELINPDRIERIGEVTKPIRGLERSRATLSDGISVTLTCEIDAIERALLPVVVAAPGYVHLRYYDDAEEGEPDIQETVVRMPIVAWRIAADRALPVLVTELMESSACFGEAVLQPDGQVVAPYEGRWLDEAEWRAEMKAVAKATRKAQAEREAKLALVPTSSKG
jgi:hypothetical protein